MKVSTFKKKFSKLNPQQKTVAIAAMKKADIIKDHFPDLPKNQHARAIREFKELITWCENETSEGISRGIARIINEMIQQNG